MPIASVIIPLYNQKQFVAQAIDSVLAQSGSEIEIIVIDDGSTDSPETVLDSYDADIKLIRQKNSGLAAARNAGLEVATGEYIQLLDADDYLFPGKIERQCAAMQTADARVSYCEVTQYDNLTNISTLRYVGELADPFASLYNTWLAYPFPVHSLLFQRAVFAEYGNFPTDLYAAEDRLFLSTLALAGERFHYWPSIGGARRVHSRNMNKQRLHIYTNMIRYYQKINQHEGVADYFNRTSKLSTDSLVSANLTHMLLHDLASGTSITTLASIYTAIRGAGYGLCFSAIPKPVVFCRPVVLPLLALGRRVIRHLNKFAEKSGK